MGTAPPRQQPDPLPDPSQLLDGIVGTLGQLGMAGQDALETTLQIAHHVRHLLWPAGAAEGRWIDDLISCCVVRLSVSYPSDTEHTGDDHADGHSG